MEKVTHKAIKVREDWISYEYIACNTNIDIRNNEFSNIQWSFHWDDISCRKCLKKRPEETD